VSMGDGYVFRVILTCRYPLEAHLSRTVGEEGVEPQFRRFSMRRSVPW